MTVATPNTGLYQHLLLVVDLSDDSQVIGARARAIAAACGARVSLLHVVEFVPVEPLGESLLPAVEIEEELVKRARERLTALASAIGLPEAPTRVATGNTKTEIVNVAADIGADLVVLGSRERHGLSILVNFTEDSVLHAAPCDVLAVRLR
jgi:universal stress protein A